MFASPGFTVPMFSECWTTNMTGISCCYCFRNMANLKQVVMRCYQEFRKQQYFDVFSVLFLLMHVGISKNTVA